ncbi:hypothetical protein SAMN04490355_10664 [Pelosinus propionicus DSM 13327]|uniref:Uncharacterized protein n=1 Tax=Pelosinus propionicus DSM 13327 TaxID=1123291 RepID=A0A1I4PKC1_9FIRM|nr:hypothetical protein SAMN04490355_10664 [Pelosinus propionicus DSM 13327]
MEWLDGLSLLWLAMGVIFIVGTLFIATVVCFFRKFIESHCSSIDNEKTTIRLADGKREPRKLSLEPELTMSPKNNC